MQTQVGAHLERVVVDRGNLGAMRSIFAMATTLPVSAGSRAATISPTPPEAP